MTAFEEMLAREKKNLRDWLELDDWSAVLFCADRIKYLSKAVEEECKFEHFKTTPLYKKLDAA